jgi:hypothetical protein
MMSPVLRFRSNRTPGGRDARAPLSRRVERAFRRSARKHALAIALLSLALAIIFFPSLFMGRLLSPNDVFFAYYPWQAAAQIESQNPLIHDAPTSYYTMMSLLKGEWGAFHWNPYIGAGIPGFGSAASAVLTPFIALPVLLLPLRCVYGAVVLLKIVFPFVFAYLWLREERLGKKGAAAGAAVFSLAGTYAVWWMWQATNATVLFPVALWFAARLVRGRRVPFGGVVLFAFAYAMSGFPAVAAYGVYAVLLAFLYGAVRYRALRGGELGKTALATAAGLVIALPLIAPFAQFLLRTGYLSIREEIAATMIFPLEHLAAFVFPFRYGSPAQHLWTGIEGLPQGSNFVEATVYAGLVTLLLAFAGLFRRRADARWFWAAFFALVCVTIFVRTPLSEAVASLPGIRYSPLIRLRVLLPIPLAYLAAAGAAALFSMHAVRSRRVLRYAAAALVMTIALELGFFAASFYPYVEPKYAEPPLTPAVEFLQSERGAHRFAGFFPWLIPNTSELYRVEDIRTHFSAEADYRRMLLRLDPTAWSMSTINTFNSLHFDFFDPLVSMLGTRHFVEQPNIDIITWTVIGATEPGVEQDGWFVLGSGGKAQVTVSVGDGPFRAVELSVELRRALSPAGKLDLRMRRPETGEVLTERSLGVAELRRTGKIYLKVPRGSVAGEAFVVDLEATGATVRFPGSEGGRSLYYGRVTKPLVLVRQFEDGRVFENLDALPRWWPVWESLALDREEFFARKDVDYGRVAVVEQRSPALEALAATPAERRRVGLEVVSQRPAEQVIRVKSEVGFLLASSEKVTPELRVFVDGEVVDPVRINLLFAGVPVAAGEHVVRFERRIGRGFWIPSFAALALVLFGPLAMRIRSASSRRR